MARRLGSRSHSRCWALAPRSVPTHAVPGFLQPAAITVGPKSVTAAITLALRRLTGDRPTSRELSDVPY